MSLHNLVDFFQKNKLDMLKINKFNTISCFISIAIILNFYLKQTSFDFKKLSFLFAVSFTIVCIFLFILTCHTYLTDLTDFHCHGSILKNITDRIVDYGMIIILYYVPIVICFSYKNIIRFQATKYIINIVMMLWIIYDVSYLLIAIFLYEKNGMPYTINIKNLKQYEIQLCNDYCVILLHKNKYFVYKIHNNCCQKMLSFNNYCEAERYIQSIPKVEDLIKDHSSCNKKLYQADPIMNKADTFREAIKNNQ